MTVSEPSEPNERPRMSLSEMLSRSQPLRTRALPPLDQIKRSVERVLTRWPDAVFTPEDRDRERLAQNMLSRVSHWQWKTITTQRVISAAIAVFDGERCERPDLTPVREFYYSEIASREPGTFLDSMVGIYIESFTPGARHTLQLARALEKRASDLGGRYRKLLGALPDLFGPDAAPASLAGVMHEVDDAYRMLQSIGLSRPHTAGLAKAAQKPFFDRLAPDLANAEARRKLFNWLTPQNGPVLQAGAGPAVEALLSVWRERTPPDALRNELSETIIAAWNDPRLHTGGIWSGFDPNLRAVLLRWLTHQDMKFFCDMVTATQDNHMWPPRRNFWLKLYRDKMIDEAWVAFGSDALAYAQRNFVRKGKADMGRRFGRQLDRRGSTSLLIMRIGNKIVVDGCHSYKTHIFRMNDRNAPKLYEREYYCDDIMRASPNSKPHNSIDSWSQWVLQNV
ncbi:EH signature domain-containing protein [Paracoccus fontiphilus]|uniref:EH signature domain-containing protein n=1 Tax=Paracoccus fontiphilus TaxID=1815556 RepID=A0ABV7IAR9_9RHOB|nr:EH signature domain-containing protein [Paracoccus fontiphilus]